MIRVLIVDDSALVRQVLTTLLSADPQLEVVGTAADPFEARDKLRALRPDVMTLDVEMPRMDGLTFLRNVMRAWPTPVVMVSSLTERGADVTMAALEAGAIDFIAKPKLDVARGLEQQAAALIARVKAAARANLGARSGTITAPLPQRPPPLAGRPSERLIALGASTGGTEAVAAVLRALPAEAPGVVIAQHIPPVFSERWAKRLRDTTALEAREAADGDVVMVGHAYVAPGGQHLRLERSARGWVCRLGVDEPVNGHRPSVDVLFDSVARVVGPLAVAALLTGMGTDGALGLRQLRQRGCFTVAQNEASSVVWGMPGEAVRLGAATEVLPLEQIGRRLLEVSREHPGVLRPAG
ncbi:MAG: protein-glutamate methylesterase/protein-glutamine glutaminase [Myxococcota bacterium]